MVATVVVLKNITKGENPKNRNLPTAYYYSIELIVIATLTVVSIFPVLVSCIAYGGW